MCRSHSAWRHWLHQHGKPSVTAACHPSSDCAVERPTKCKQLCIPVNPDAVKFNLLCSCSPGRSLQQLTAPKHLVLRSLVTAQPAGRAGTAAGAAGPGTFGNSRCRVYSTRCMHSLQIVRGNAAAHPPETARPSQLHDCWQAAGGVSKAAGAGSSGYVRVLRRAPSRAARSNGSHAAVLDVAWQNTTPRAGLGGGLCSERSEKYMRTILANCIPQPLWRNVALNRLWLASLTRRSALTWNERRGFVAAACLVGETCHVAPPRWCMIFATHLCLAPVRSTMRLQVQNSKMNPASFV